MAASLRQTICLLHKHSTLNISHNVAVVQRLNYSHKTKRRSAPRKYPERFYDEHRAELYTTGETRQDRYRGVPAEEKVHPETFKNGEYELDPPKGHIYDKKPFPVLLKAQKKYKWCACGYSNHQPFCDGSHITINEKNIVKPRHTLIHHQPVTFAVPEDGEYWLCQCKQTNDRPFCDGSHLAEHIQNKIKA